MYLFENIYLNVNMHYSNNVDTIVHVFFAALHSTQSSSQEQKCRK